MRSFNFLLSPLLLSLSVLGLPLAVIDTPANNAAISSDKSPRSLGKGAPAEWCCGVCPCGAVENSQTNNTATNVTPASGMKAVKKRQIDTTTPEASLLS